MFAIVVIEATPELINKPAWSNAVSLCSRGFLIVLVVIRTSQALLVVVRANSHFSLFKKPRLRGKGNLSARPVYWPDLAICKLILVTPQLKSFGPGFVQKKFS
jgi:hypothetical protein